jgi:TRAP-type C4-dicarboxylate transport system substrate-binding protein
VQTAPGGVAPALGAAWSTATATDPGIFDLGWHGRPSSASSASTAPVSILINKASWAKLNDQQKKVIADAAAWIEAQAAEVTKENEAETAKQAAAGIQVIKFSDAQAAEYRKKAFEAGWAGVIKQSPEHGPKLKELFVKAN